MSTIGKTHPLVVVGLLMLTTVPLVAGAFRVVELMGNAEITAENARFFAAPIPVVTHIVSSLLFCVFGAFQFSPRLRRSRPGWHRAGGRIAVPMGFAAALSGLWMTQFYPWAGYDGPALYVIRLVVGTSDGLVFGVGDSGHPQAEHSQPRQLDDQSLCTGHGSGDTGVHTYSLVRVS